MPENDSTGSIMNESTHVHKNTQFKLPMSEQGNSAFSLSKVKTRPFSYLLSFLTGGILGILLLHPIAMTLYWLEFHPYAQNKVSYWSFALTRVRDAFSSKMLVMSLVYFVLGGLTALVVNLVMNTVSKQRRKIDFLEKEFERELETLLSQGETETREFKSSLRWDRHLLRVNHALEDAVIKTIAGFMNYNGGSIFIGVDDKGQVPGLDEDMKTLKRPDRDGYESYIMSLIAHRIGTQFCPFVHILFHTYQNKTICRILVEPTPEPAYVKKGDKIQFFVRTGNSTRELNIQEAIQYISSRWHHE